MHFMTKSYLYFKIVTLAVVLRTESREGMDEKRENGLRLVQQFKQGITLACTQSFSTGAGKGSQILNLFKRIYWWIGYAM